MCYLILALMVFVISAVLVVFAAMRSSQISRGDQTVGGRRQ
jgi:hypothetical protein